MKFTEECRKVNIFVMLFVASLVFLSGSVDVSAAAKHQFKVELVKCPIADENDIYTSYDQCVTDYMDGNMDSYIYKEGDNVEPGTYVLAFVKYIYRGTPEVLAYNADLQINAKYWDLAYDSEYDTFYSGNNVTNTDLPYAMDGRKKVYPWSNIETNVYKNMDYKGNPDPNTHIMVVSANISGSYLPYLEKDYVLGHVLLQLKPNATAGETMQFTFSELSDMGTDMSINPDFKAPMETVPFSVAVAGDTVSSDNSLKTLSVEGNLSSGRSYTYDLDPAFVPGDATNKEFKVIVPHETNTVTINAEAKDSTIKGMTITTPKGGTDYSVDVGNNNFEISVTAASGDIAIYKVNVYRLNNNAFLDNIQFTNGVALENFDGGDVYYTVTVPYAVKSTTVTATTDDVNATVDSGNKEWQLPNYGRTEGVTDYKNDPKANIIKIDTCAENCKYHITGSVNTAKSYYIYVFREDPSDNKYLSDLKVNNTTVSGFQKTKFDYVLDDVGYDTTYLNINAVVEDTDKATLSGQLGTVNLNVGDNTITVTVTAEDGTTQDYTISVRRKNNDAKLSSLTVTSTPQGTLLPGFNSDFGGDYTYSYDPTVTSVLIKAQANDPNATISLIDSTNATIAGTNGVVSATYGTSISKVRVQVISENNDINYYSIVLERGKSSDATLKDLKINNVSIDGFSSGTKRYSYTVSSDTETVDVLGVANDSNAQIVSGNGTTSYLNFGSTNTIEVKVRPEIGVDKNVADYDVSYYIDITREKYDIATLKELTVSTTSGPLLQTYDSSSDTYDTYIFNPDTKSYYFKVPYDVSSVNIAAKATNMYATIDQADIGNRNLDTGDNSLNVHVTAHDDVTTDLYTVHVYRELNSDNSIKSISVKGKAPTLREDGKYEITLDNNISSLTPSDIVINASPDATVIKQDTDFDLVTGANTYNFTVQAENGDEKDYSIIINRKKSSDNSISVVTLITSTDITRSCTMEGTGCKIEVPVDTEHFSLTAKIPATASVSPINGTEYDMSVTESSKEITLTVTAEDGTRQDYTVTVERQKSSSNYLKELTVDGSLIENFAPGTTNYYITVESPTDKVKFGASVQDTGKAKIYLEDFEANPSAQAYDSISDIEKTLVFGNTNNFYIYVKAENGNKATYAINITRKASADATLKKLTVNNNLVDGFAPETFIYNLANVDYNTTHLNIGAETNDPNATVTGTGVISLKPGANQITVHVSSQDGEVHLDYTVNVHRSLSTDTTIKGVSVAGVAADCNMTSKICTVTVPNSVDKADASNVVVDVNDPLVETDPKATYSVEPKNLSTKDVTPVKITVTSNYGNTDIYTVNVTREKSNISSLDSLTVTNGSFAPSFTKDNLQYTVTVPVDTTNFTVSATKTDPASTITSGTGLFTMTSSTMQVNVRVESEDGNSSTVYVLNVVRTASSDNTLKKFEVKSTDGTRIYPLENDEGTIITFDPETTSYVVHVDGSVDKVNIVADANDGRASVLGDVGEQTLDVGDNTFTVRVKSEAGAGQNYNLKIVRAKKTDANLTAITIDGVPIPDFDPDVITYNIGTFPNDKHSIIIGATKSDNDADVTGLGSKGLLTGKNSFVVKVTAQDNTVVKTYTLNYEREKSNNAYLQALDIAGYTLEPEFDPAHPEKLDYTVTVDEDKATLSPNEVTAIAADRKNANVSKPETITLSSEIPKFYNITVTAENGNSNIYTIKVIRPESSDATLSNVNITGGSLVSTFDPSKTEYTITVPYGATTFSIDGIPNVDTTDVYGDGGPFNVADFKTKNLVITTYAENGNRLQYQFKIVEAASNEASLTELSVSGYPFDKTFSSATTIYDIGNIPYDTSSLKINARATNSNSTIEYYVNSVLQTSSEVKIPISVGSGTITVKVIAPDGVTDKDYNISFNKVYSSNAYLSDLTTPLGDLGFNKYENSYELHIANNVNSVPFTITTEDNKASIKIGENIYSSPKTIDYPITKDGITTLTIMVVAQDTKTTNPYTVTINRASASASENAFLQSLDVEDYPFPIDFSRDNYEYSIGDDIPYDLETLTINAVTEEDDATIRYIVDGKTYTTNKVPISKTAGPGEVIVKVTAGDGLTTKEYKILYNKEEASENVYLSSLTINSGTIDFVKTKKTYTVNVSEDVTSVELVATAEDAKAKISYNGTLYESPHTITLSDLAMGPNVVTIIVKSESGEATSTYKVTINRGEAISEKITSHEYGHTIDDNFIRTVHPEQTALDMKNQLDNENEYLEIWTADESKKLSDSDTVGTGMIVKLIIGGEEKDRKAIVIVGDTSGDGAISMFDAVAILNHVLKDEILDGAYYIAGDTNRDGDISMFDAVGILNHVLKDELLY